MNEDKYKLELALSKDIEQFYRMYNVGAKLDDLRLQVALIELDLAEYYDTIGERHHTEKKMVIFYEKLWGK